MHARDFTRRRPACVRARTLRPRPALLGARSAIDNRSGAAELSGGLSLGDAARVAHRANAGGRGGQGPGGNSGGSLGLAPRGRRALAASLPFLACGATHPLAAIPGILLLNLTMPVTLAATVEALPGYPGFAFGLTCLALLVGAVPALLGVSMSGPILVSVVILLSAAALYRGLRMLPPARSFRETMGGCQ